MKKVHGRLVLVLGDQLDTDNPAIKDLDFRNDHIWMAEAREESTHVWSSKIRIAYFLTAMRHFRQELESKGYPVIYRPLNGSRPSSLAGILDADLKRLRPVAVHMVEAGDFRVQRAIESVVAAQGIELTVLPDPHFLTDSATFNDWADSRKNLRQEDFYRFQRRRHGVLMEGRGPAGGKWNYDSENRKSFPRAGPGTIPPWPAYPPDRITTEVVRIVEEAFPDHPGDLSTFDWPVTRRQAQDMLDVFVGTRLATFGRYQDAMWTDQPFLYHSGLSEVLNVKLLHPRRVVDSAVRAYQSNRAPLPSVEGFVRQVLGWREYVRGVYFRYMPEYARRNALGAVRDLPRFYWTGDTDMTCLRQVLGQTLRYGYAHHIQRLMVTGLFALLLGVAPRQVHQWYLSVYVDAVEWVELPNTLGMSQFADGGLLASKPYVASGRYIQRMSNYCRHCRYDPGTATGDDACPFTTLYWDFLQRHAERFGRHPRTALQWKNLDRLSDADRSDIRRQAAKVRRGFR